MREAISSALKAAMKERDATRTGALRLISAAMKDRDIEARGRGRERATDEELLATLARMIKQREESARLYDDGGRPELAAKERGEIEVIRGFMPAPMGEAELDAAVRAGIGEAGAASLKDMGRVMALLKERHAGGMDFARASALVKARLA